MGSSPAAWLRRSAFGASALFSLHTLPECIHQVDYIGWRTLFWLLDLLALLLFLEQVLQGILVAIFKLLRIEAAGLRFDDVRGKFEHVFWNFLIGDVVEILVLLANFIRITQRHAQEALA